MSKVKYDYEIRPQSQFKLAVKKNNQVGVNSKPAFLSQPSGQVLARNSYTPKVKASNKPAAAIKIPKNNISCKKTIEPTSTAIKALAPPVVNRVNTPPTNKVDSTVETTPNIDWNYHYQPQPTQPTNAVGYQTPTNSSRLQASASKIQVKRSTSSGPSWHSPHLSQTATPRLPDFDQGYRQLFENWDKSSEVATNRFSQALFDRPQTPYDLPLSRKKTTWLKPSINFLVPWKEVKFSKVSLVVVGIAIGWFLLPSSPESQADFSYGHFSYLSRQADVQAADAFIQEIETERFLHEEEVSQVESSPFMVNHKIVQQGLSPLLQISLGDSQQGQWSKWWNRTIQETPKSSN